MTIRLSDSSFAPLLKINMETTKWNTLIVFKVKYVNFEHSHYCQIATLSVWYDFYISKINRMTLLDQFDFVFVRNNKHLFEHLCKLKEEHSLNLNF